jgi:predicted ATPase
MHVAAEVLEDYPDGVWLADLAAVADPDAVPTQVGQIFALKEGPGMTATDAVAGYLGNKHALLILDNCEHVLEAAAALADRLGSSCPTVRILATTRQPLDLPSDVTWRVPSLAVPDDHDQTDTGPAATAGLAACEAVQLFVDRASRARPGFALTEANSSAVADVCRRLDGIPLAIELAAARVRVFTPAQISAGLDQRFALLTGAPRTALLRQQTLQASVDWSHDLLTDLEQAVFRRLSAFAGDFDYDDAAAVCAAPPLAPHQVLDQLSLLVDKSLVQVDDSGEIARYRLLETVRYYAAAQLARSGEDRVTRTRHRDHYLAFAEEAEGYLEGPGQSVWINRVATEYPNLRAAVTWSREHHQTEPVARIATALNVFWMGHGPSNEGEAWFQDALEQTGHSATALRARTLCAASWLACATWNLATAVSTAEEGLALARDLADDRLLGRFLIARGVAAMYAGQPTNLIEEAVGLTRQVDDRFALAVALTALAQRQVMQNPTKARPYVDEAVGVAQKTGNVIFANNALGNLAIVMGQQGDLRQVAGICEQVLESAHRAGDRLAACIALSEKAAVLVETDRCVEALEAADSLQQTAQEAGMPMFDVQVAVVRCKIALSEGDHTGALRHGQEAMVAASTPAPRCDALLAVIEAELAAGLASKAAADIDELVDLSETAGYEYRLARALVLKARLGRIAGDPATADTVGQHALAAVTAAGAKCRIVDTLELLAGASGELGNPQAAALSLRCRRTPSRRNRLYGLHLRARR